MPVEEVIGSKEQRKKLKKLKKKLNKNETRRAKALADLDVQRDRVEAKFDRKIEKRTKKIEALQEIMAQQPDAAYEPPSGDPPAYKGKKKAKKKRGIPQE